MLRWIANAAGTVVWRKILADHPGLLELLLPGNEATLAAARAKLPELDTAFLRFGPPPVKLLAELLAGGQAEWAPGLRVGSSRCI